MAIGDGGGGGEAMRLPEESALRSLPYHASTQSDGGRRVLPAAASAVHHGAAAAALHALLGAVPDG
eukprot:6226381-Prymnesium_polylepis.2